MAEKKPQETEPESSEFATQKIDREELFGAEAEKKELEHATQKIDDSVLEAAVAQQAMDSAATMKVSETELKQAMAEEMEKAKQPASGAPVKEPPLTGEVVDKPGAAKEGKSTTNTTIVAIIAAAVVLLACICVCPLTVAAIVYFTNQ